MTPRIPQPAGRQRSTEQPRCRWRCAGGWGLVEWSGEIDLAATPVCSSALEAAAGHCSSGLVLDLTGVTFMDSSGLALLDAALRAVPPLARVLVLPPAPPARRVLELSGMTDALPLVEDVLLPAAVAALRAPRDEGESHEPVLDGTATG